MEIPMFDISLFEVHFTDKNCWRVNILTVGYNAYEGSLFQLERDEVFTGGKHIEWEFDLFWFEIIRKIIGWK